MKYISLFVLTFSVLLTSCGSKINKEQQQKLEALTVKVNSITKKVNELDSAALVKLTDEFFERRNFIQQKMTDTLPPEMIFMLDAFIQLRKEMGYIRGQYGMIKLEANILQQQLVDLNHDVSKRLVEEKRFDKYYDLEFQNYNQLSTAASGLFSGVETGTKKYNEMVGEVDSLIKAYKAKLNE